MLGSRKSFQKRLLQWYQSHRRDLPWRTNDSSLPDPYRTLISEIMLQQTQVVTVIPYFNRFIQHFPTLSHLAKADLAHVLRLWQGLGYYSRARNLHLAARQIVQQFDGVIPSTVSELRALPGIGPYTAGAIASLAFGRREPVVDGNIVRVICRLDGIQADPRLPRVKRLLWQRAGELLPDANIAAHNSAFMELGAMVCTPHQPKCAECPISLHCDARTKGTECLLPIRTRRKPKPVEKRWIFCAVHRRRVLIEQRPSGGRWAGLWQFLTVPAVGEATPEAFRRISGLGTDRLQELGRFRHQLTHRSYEFEVFLCRCTGPGQKRSAGSWVRPAELRSYAMSKPQVLALEMFSVAWT